MDTSATTPANASTESMIPREIHEAAKKRAGQAWIIENGVDSVVGQPRLELLERLPRFGGEQPCRQLGVVTGQSMTSVSENHCCAPLLFTRSYPAKATTMLLGREGARSAALGGWKCQKAGDCRDSGLGNRNSVVKGREPRLWPAAPVFVCHPEKRRDEGPLSRRRCRALSSALRGPSVAEAPSG